MSFALKPTITIEFSFRDNDGARSTTEVLLPGGTSAANAITFAAAIRPLLQALSDAVIVAMNVIIGYYENAIPTIPSSDVENKGVFVFNAANGIKSSVSVPSILEAVLQSNNRDTDQAQSDVDDFITAMTAGLSSIQPCNLSGADLVSVRDAYKQNRRSHLSGRSRKG
jgi:hypothetical protein